MSLGPLIILSGPSGSGKSTVIRELLQRSSLPLYQSISVTTRPPRPEEHDGIDYHFCTPEQFRQYIHSGELLEWAQVHGNYYGTLRREVDDRRARGIGVVLVIDVQGAAQVRSRYPNDHLSVFLTTSSPEIYEQRLRDRGTEDQASLERRIQTARSELARSGEYHHVVYNDDLDQAVDQLNQRIEAAFNQNCSGNNC